MKLVDSEGNESEVVTFEANILCFVADTKIYTPGGFCNIQDIKVGDMVYSMNMEIMQVEIKKVRQTFVNEVKGNTIKIHTKEGYVESTDAHEYYEINKGWIPAYKLKEGDILLNTNGEQEEIIKIETKYNESITVYNFEVEDNHNYFVGIDKLLVHNAYGAGTRNCMTGGGAAS